MRLQVSVVAAFTGRRGLDSRPYFPGPAESSPSPPGVYSVARSGLRTLPDGEFDWGGTSVKR